MFSWPDAKEIHPARITKQFERLSKQAELPKIRLHDLWHGWASHAIHQGSTQRPFQVGLVAIQSGSTMATYAHPIAEAEAKAAETMGAVLLG